MNLSSFVFSLGFGVITSCLLVLTFAIGPMVIRQLVSIESLLRELVQASHREEMRR